MIRLPTVITSSVIRSTHKGESHGGVYIVDLETGSYEQVIDWDDEDISWKGRGFDRGLRGIDFYEDKIYLAASDEIFVCNKDFEIIKSYKNKYLKHCHEIFIKNDTLFLTSTGFDSILEFNLNSEKFVRGYCVRYGRGLRHRKARKFLKKFGVVLKPKLDIFDPDSNKGPSTNDEIHINNVWYSNDRIYFSGTNINSLFYIQNNELFSYAEIPYKTHNCQPFKEGVLFNDTSNGRVTYSDKNLNIIETFPIKTYKEENLLNSHLPKDHARQAFGRGLCTTNDLIIGGSSPATIAVYKFGQSTPIKTINITMDVRNSIHGLEIWPY